MKLLKYKLSRSKEEEWNFTGIEFSRINLLVGASGTGKTRFLNTIINFLRQLTSDKLLYDGVWEVEFEVNGVIYEYKLSVKHRDRNLAEKFIEREKLNDNTNNILLVDRTEGNLSWKGEKLPKLNDQISCFVLLKQEEEINIIHNNLQLFVARRFNGDELSKSFNWGALHPEVVKELVDTKNKDFLMKNVIDFHSKMNLLSRIDIDSYNLVCNLIKQAFPFISDTSIESISEALPELINLPVMAPVFCIKERGFDKIIAVRDISSGMQKMFLLILDTVLFKDSGILLIDEYENSLGINAINFLPDLLVEVGEKCQFIMTSHHPYIINHINIDCWKIFHRKGMDVDILDGKELKEKFKHSRQEHFIQLINNEFYKDGIE